MDAILNINKPRGVTSFGVVARLRKLTGIRKIGHAGTLDPDAEGVLPVCLGRATRVIEFLADARKTYRAEIELGISTDTYDGAGKVMRAADASSVSRGQVEEALSAFQGVIEQTPPRYSALKLRGKPLYEWARRGIEVEPRSRPVQIYSLRLVDWQSPIFTIEVECGKGTYIRSLAHDVGERLGCGAHLKHLVRLRYGVFALDGAVSLGDFEEAAAGGYWGYFAYPMDSVFLDWSALVLGEERCRAVVNGQPLAFAAVPPEATRCRVYSTRGCLVGVLRFDGERRQWRPHKVLV